MIALESNAFLDVFTLPYRGTVYLLQWFEEVSDAELRTWAGQIISIDNEIKIVKSARFYMTADSPTQYILGLLI